LEVSTLTRKNASFSIIRVSTSGQFAKPISLPDQTTDLINAPNHRIFLGGLVGDNLGVATANGVVVSIPAGTTSLSAALGGWAELNDTIGPDGNVWLSDGFSQIVRLSGLDTPLGGLDTRQPVSIDLRTDAAMSPTSHPTFAGIARPGAIVTLTAEVKGSRKTIALGTARASATDGSWTLRTKTPLANRTYAVYASQSNDPSPPTVLYSLTPDDSGNLSNALVVKAEPGK
jgi:hypothetical protein